MFYLAVNILTFAYVRTTSLQIFFKLRNIKMQTLSQVVALEEVSVPQPREVNDSKRLGRRKDCIELRSHLIKFVKCVNRSSDGTIANYSPSHGHVEVEVHYLQGPNKDGEDRSRPVDDIDVILTSLPSEELTIDQVTLINFKVKRKLKEKEPVTKVVDVFYYETLIYQSILALYSTKTRIVTTPTDFDAGCAQVGGPANTWFARRFGLRRGFQGSVVLREGVL